MENVRFEVTLNGKRLCTAGLDDYGMLTVGVAMTAFQTENPSPAEEDTIAINSSQSLFVGGGEFNDTSTLKHLVWGEQSLEEGDEVLVRVLPEGRHDPPIAAFADLKSGLAWKGPDAFAREIGNRSQKRSGQKESDSGNARFEILHNGKRLCVTGRNSAGAACVLITARTRHPDLDKGIPADSGRAKTGLSATITGFSVGQLNQRLCVWDEMLFHILPPGECDPAIHPRAPGSPNWASRAYVYPPPNTKHDG
jgi:hypothetical protein